MVVFLAVFQKARKRRSGMINGTLAHRNRSDFCDLRLRCPSRTPEIASDFRGFALRFSVRWKVASDLGFRVAISEAETPSFCGISGDLVPSTRKSLAIAIVRFWCAKDGTLSICDLPKLLQTPKLPNQFGFVTKNQDTFDHDKEQVSAISGRRLHWIF